MSESDNRFHFICNSGILLGLHSGHVLRKKTHNYFWLRWLSQLHSVNGRWVAVDKPGIFIPVFNKP